MPRPIPGRASAIAILLAIVALGTILRLVPSWRGVDRDLVSDPLFHLRMTAAVAQGWHLPAVDSLACAPVGREVGRWLPTGLYWVAGAFHRVLYALEGRDLATHARLFIALAGALIALPVYGATRALHRGRAPALIAALVAVALPAHVHRSFGYWFRYDALGTLLITTHVALSLAALAAESRRSARMAATGAAIALVAALAVWRVPLLVPVLEVGFVLAFAVARQPGLALREWWTAQVVAGTIACLGLQYLRDQSFVLSSAWLLSIAVAAALWVPLLRREALPLPGRAVSMALALVAALAGGRLAGPRSPYGEVLDSAVRKVVEHLGVHFTPTPLTRLALSVDELQGLAIADLFGPGALSWLAVPFVVAPIVWLAIRRRGSGIAPAAALLAWLAAGLAVGTLLFARNKIVLAPLVAIVIGGLFAALAPATSAAPAPPRRPRSQGAGGGAGTIARAIAGALLVALIAVAAWDSVRLALTRTSRMEPGQRAALAWLARETPPGAVVLAPWERGYEIQGYARRRTVLDGLLEDPLNQRRIVEVARAWMAPATDPLVAVCERTGAGYVLVPPSTALHGIAVLTDWPASWKVRAGRPLNRQDADNVLVRMMVLGESPPPFEPVFRSGDWRVYRRVR
jgi:asparagine N-glycosylation enzyme membrane subunit Stt3